MSAFPIDAERQVAYARCIDKMRPHHRHLPGEDITCACSDEHADDVLAALAPLIAAREAAARRAGAVEALRKASNRVTDPFSQGQLSGMANRIEQEADR